MARTHAQRRRQNLLVTVALVATALVLLFAHDVNRAAHSSTNVRRSENRSFASLANALLDSEQQFGDHLDYLLTHGATLSRAVFTARLDQLALQLPAWSSEANLLRHPAIAGDLNTTLANLTTQRVDDYQVVLDSVARTLDLPWTPLSSTATTSVAARSSLLATDRSWDALRGSLVGEPGAVRLARTTTPGAVVTLPTVLATLDAAASLRVRRGVSISAVEVTPSPLPAAAGTIVLPPVTSVHLGVSVTNDQFVRQPVVLTVTFTVRTGALATPQTQRMAVTLGPTRSYAFVPRLLVTAPGEHANLTITLSGTARAPAPTQRRTYQFVLSPSGA